MMEIENIWETKYYIIDYIDALLEGDGIVESNFVH